MKYDLFSLKTVSKKYDKYESIIHFFYSIFFQLQKILYLDIFTLIRNMYITKMFRWINSKRRTIKKKQKQNYYLMLFVLVDLGNLESTFSRRHFLPQSPKANCLCLGQLRPNQVLFAYNNS